VIKYVSLLMVGLLSLGGQAKTSMFDNNVNNTTLLNPDCPLMLAGIYQDSALSKRNRVSVHFVNQTESRVIGVKVGFGGRDAVWDVETLLKTYSVVVDLRPHRTDAPIWKVNDPDFEANTAGGISVYLIKVMFENGSTWKDDGTRSCSLAVSGRPKRHKHENDDDN
jgi:hypothetical protein